ncbi:hypothetical protein I311_04862 [Cryptococcus gattii NT-10]|nr:hypothetical protein I311_04862 [Cryptococcus gattii NT-10]
MKKNTEMKWCGIQISLIRSSKRSTDSTKFNRNMGNLLLDHKLPNGTAANLIDLLSSRVLNRGTRAWYTGVSMLHQSIAASGSRIWKGIYCARFLAQDPQLPDVIGLPRYLFPWDLFLDSENAEEAVKNIFDSPVLMRACKLLFVGAGDGEGSSWGRKSVAGKQLVLHWQHILYIASLVAHCLSSTQL